MASYIQQNTIATSASCSGIGAHSGRQVNITIKPAPANHGIKFIRTDLPGNPGVKAIFKMVVDTSMATVIGDNGVIVSTIEHMMACFAGFSIDNAIVELDGHEIPIMDGSAEKYATMIKEAGVQQLDAPRCYFVVTKPILLEENGKSVSIEPSSGYKLTCSIDFDHPMIQQQTYSIENIENNFGKELSKARTFGFLHELEFLKRYELAQGVSLESGVAFDKEGILNEEGLRFKDECVRHKLLDCIGDFSLLGMPLIGHVITNKSGHAFNHAFIKKFFEEKSSWETRQINSSENTLQPNSLAI